MACRLLDCYSTAEVRHGLSVLIEERSGTVHVARNLIRSAELSPQLRCSPLRVCSGLSWPVEEVGLELELFDDGVRESRDAVRWTPTS
jgi:hypothetical protein